MRDGASSGMRAERREALDRLRSEVRGTADQVSSELAGLTVRTRGGAALSTRGEQEIADRLMAIEASLLTIERHWSDYLQRFPLACVEVGAQSRVEDFTRSAA